MARHVRGYVSPAPGAAIGRTDQGVDWSTLPGDPIVSIGAAVVDFVGRYTGFGNYVAYRLTEGPAAGEEVYTAEFGAPVVHVGQRLRRGQLLGHEAAGTPSGIEAGFAQGAPTYLPIAQIEGPHGEGVVTAAGRRFRALFGGDSGNGGNGGGADSISIEQLWIDAGGPANVAQIMAAIALAESGGKIDARGGPNSDGSYDYGLWQINSSHRAYDPQRLLSDPRYNARAAVSVYHSQGLRAWTTYRNGAYRAFMSRADAATVQVRSRPIPPDPADDGSAEASANQLASWQDYVTPGLPFGLPWNPLKLFQDTQSAISDVATFLKWIAWLFHPRNILRIVEFTAGVGMMGFGLWSAVKTFQGAAAPSSPVKSAARVLTVTPPGRALKVGQAARQGRRAARTGRRFEQERQAFKRGKRGEQTRLSNREFGRRAGRGPSGDIPF